MKIKFNYQPLILLYSHVWNLSNNSINLNEYIKAIYKSSWNIKLDIKSDIIFFQSMKRDDYTSFTTQIFNAIDTENKTFIILEEIAETNKYFSKKLNKYFLDIWKELYDINNLRQKIYILLSIVRDISIIEDLETYNVKCVVAHADMQAIENIVIQYFKYKNIPTVTLQHGLYIDYTKEPNINEVNYKNVVSEYFLAWGEETKALINFYHKECKVHICGNPTICMKTNVKDNFFVIIFEHEGNKIYNYELLSIAREVSKLLNLPLKVKLHPNNIFADYDISRDEVVKYDNVYNADFAIGHTSTMMYELMRNGIAVFKMQSFSPSNNIKDIFLFNNIDLLIKKIKNISKIDYKYESKFYIKYIEKESLLQYKLFFRKLFI